MKSFYLATAAVAVLIVSPAAAQDRVGSVGVSYGAPTLSIGDSEAEADVWTIDGVIALPLSDWTVTLNGSADRAENELADNFLGGGAVHLSRTWGPDLRAGGFIGADGLGDGNQSWTAGAEIQKYFAGATVTGQAAYTTVDDIDTDIVTLGGEAAFYLGRALRLHVAASYNSVGIPDDDVEAWTYGVGAEYRLADTPFTLVGDYTRIDMDSLEADTWVIGLRYNFGGDLRQRDRSGGNLRFEPLMRTLDVFGGDDGEDDNSGGGNGPL